MTWILVGFRTFPKKYTNIIEYESYFKLKNN